MDIKSDLTAQGTATPAIFIQTKDTKKAETLELRQWMNWETIQTTDPKKILKEFELLKTSLKKNKTNVLTVQVTPSEKIKIFHTRGLTGILPEKYVVLRIKKVNGKDTLLRTTTYEVYPDKDNPKNYRLVKLVVKETPVKDEALPVVDTEVQTIEVKDGKLRYIHPGDDDDEMLKAVFKNEADYEAAKAVL
ncbi:MAG: hypothetical protein ABIH00_00620, partial [Armatimonadota bacterium]